MAAVCRTVKTEDVYMGKGLRMLAAAMSVALMLPLVACKKRSGSAKYEESPTLVKEDDPYFNAEKTTLKMEVDPEKEVDFAYVDNVRFIGDKILYSYHISYHAPKDAGFTLLEYQDDRRVVYDLQGNKLFDLANRPNESRVTATADKDGTVYLLTAFLDSQYKYHYELDRAENGEYVKVFALPELDETPSFNGDMQILENGDFMISLDGAMRIYSPTGEKRCSVSDHGRTITPRVFHINGKDYVLTRKNTMDGDTEPLLKELDLKTGKLGQGRDAKKLVEYGSIMAAEDGIYVSSHSKLFKYDMEKDSLDVVFDWNDTDVDMSPMNNAFFLVKSENEIYVVYRYILKSEPTDAELVRLTRAEKNPHAGKKIITVGGRSLDFSFLTFVSNYNSDPNRECRIKVRSYREEITLSGKDPDDTNYEDYVRQDILSGTAPDIIMNFESCTSLFNENVMVDLKPFIDGANGLDRSLIYDNVLTAFEKNGKQYFVPLTYTVNAILANDEYIPKDANWTYEGYMATATSIPENVTFCESMLKSQLLSTLYQTSAGQFVDYEKQQVNFDKEDFYTMLEIANRLGVDKIEENPAKQVTYTEDGTIMITYEGSGDPEFEEENKFRDGAIATVIELVYDVKSYGTCVELLGDKGSFRGYPGKEGAGNYAQADLSMGIPVCSKNRNSAWEVIRALYEDEAQLTLTELYGFPMTKKAYRTDAENDLSKLREEWKRYEDDEYAVEILHLPQVKEEYIDKLEQLILTVDRAYEMDMAIMDIMLEESAAYFAGDRTKEDVAKIINNRASTAVRER